MLISELYLENFRNYKSFSLEFAPGINAIIGLNAQGKTNLLEAIHLLITGQSFRTQHLADLIGSHGEGFSLGAVFCKNTIRQKIHIYYTPSYRRVVHNNTSYTTFARLIGILQGVTLSPEDQGLIKGSPSQRRRFLDLHLSQCMPLYVHFLSRYCRAMKQRNHLLRTRNLTTVVHWEEMMAHAAAYITLYRQGSINNLAIDCNDLHYILSGEQEKLSLSYKTMAPVEEYSNDIIREYYLSQYLKYRHREIDRGMTLFGLHRDDLELTINSQNARVYASEGQQRSGVAALRLAQWHNLNREEQDIPLMLIDDLGVSLDKERVQQLCTYLKGLGQSFITVQDLKYAQADHIIEIKKTCDNNAYPVILK